MKKTILLLICLLIGSASIQAQSSEIESLKGLKGVRLIVQLGRAEAMEAEQRPVVLAMLQKDVEAKLTQAGIPLLKSPDVDNEPGSPTFHVWVTFDKPNGYTYPVRAASKLIQKVRLSRNSLIELSLPTWEEWGVGVYDIKDLNMLLSNVGQIVDRFIKEYLISNPKLK
jgi:hypothetical protein